MTRGHGPEASARALVLKTTSAICAALLCLVAGIVAAVPAAAAEYSLFDRFSLGVGAGSLELDTVIRLDATDLGIGTELDFEKNLGLDSSEIVPSFRFGWHFKRRHDLAVRYDATDRDSSTQVLTEIRFGDLVIPVDGRVAVGFDLEELLVGYTYYPWLRDRWALGFGLGLRMLDLTANLEIVELPAGTSVEIVRETADASAPLPFVNIDYRYALTPKWRMLAGFGWLDASIDNFEGSQTVLGLNFEHLAMRRFSWGFGGGLSAVDVDVTESDFIGKMKLDIIRLGAFIKGRW